MAILLNKGRSRDPRLTIISSKCNMDNMQMQFHRTDPEPNKPFEHEVKAQQRKEMSEAIEAMQKAQQEARDGAGEQKH